MKLIRTLGYKNIEYVLKQSFMTGIRSERKVMSYPNINFFITEYYMKGNHIVTVKEKANHGFMTTSLQEIQLSLFFLKNSPKENRSNTLILIDYGHLQFTDKY